MNFQKLLCLIISISCVSFFKIQARGADEPINIFKNATVKIIPIALSGYTGEVATVLRFDLEVMGFEITPPDKAQYILTGKNDSGQVEGRLQDRISQATLFAKAFTGDNLRAQAHALSDEVVSTVLRIPGIARTKIVFKQQQGKAGPAEIYIADYDGHNAKPVTQDNVNVAAPAWMPGRWHLFYTSYRSGYPWIYSHNLSTGERRPFARFPGMNSSAAISPDGKKVAMILSKAGSPDLWIANVDGTGLKQLTTTKIDESSPCWSPDGAQICFASRSNERRGLFVIPSTGGEMKRLNTGGEPNPSEPDWSPDGRSIVFTSQTRAGFSICVMAAEGGNVQPPLTVGEDPSWAPNSRTVIFTRRSGNKRVLSLLDVPTGRVKDTAQVSGSRSQPGWAK